MPIIDERGRVFGRFNLVDAAVGLLVLVLLPAAYGAYRLFKEPLPTLTGVYRALSFMCLGLVLVAIGWLYQRILFRRQAAASAAPAAPAGG